MEVVVKIINIIFNVFLYPFDLLPPQWGLILVSIAVGILMLIFFRYTANQKEIKKAKDKIRAYIFELVLYRENIRVIPIAFLNIIKYNFFYLKQMIIPLLIIIIPMILILIQLNFRYTYRSLEPHESAIVKLHFNEKTNVDDLDVKLDIPETVDVETPVLKIPDQNEMDWRISVKIAGQHELTFFVGNEKFKKYISAKRDEKIISPMRVYPDFLKLLFNPFESPLSNTSGIESIEITYPHQNLRFFNIEIHWLIVFFILSILSAFLFKGLFKVEL